MKTVIKIIFIAFLQLSVSQVAISQAPNTGAVINPTINDGDRCEDPNGCQCGHVIVDKGCLCRTTGPNGICADKPLPLWQNPWVLGGLGVLVVAAIAFGVRNKRK